MLGSRLTISGPGTQFACRVVLTTSLLALSIAAQHIINEMRENLVPDCTRTVSKSVSVVFLSLLYLSSSAREHSLFLCVNVNVNYILQEKRIRSLLSP